MDRAGDPRRFNQLEKNRRECRPARVAGPEALQSFGQRFPEFSAFDAEMRQDPGDIARPVLQEFEEQMLHVMLNNVRESELEDKDDSEEAYICCCQG